MEEPRTEDLDVSDQDLLVMARDGDRAAAVELWTRHSAYGLAVARGLASPTEDWKSLSTKAWALILHPANIEQGLDGFRPYLYMVIRAVSSYDEDTPDTFLTTAYASLPDQWCEVLWYAHVETMKPTEIAVLIGVAAAEVPRLLHQARDGLRQEWAHLHAEATEPGSICRRVWESSYVRNLTRDANTSWIENHIRTCRTCRTAHSDALSVASHLREQLLPTITGPAGAARLTTYINAYGPCMRATTDLPDKVSDLFIPRPSPPQLQSANPTHKPRFSLRAMGFKPMSGVIAVLVIILIVVIVVVATRGNPSSGPSQTTSADSSTPSTQILTVDTGTLNNLYPIVSGTTVPDTTVNIQIGSTDVRLTSDDTGAWTTEGSLLDFSSIRGVITASTDQEVDAATAVYEISEPPTVALSSGTDVTLTGLGNAVVEILVDGASTDIVTLDSTGDGTDDLTLDSGTHFIQVRYSDDSRFGPSSTAVTLTV